MNRWLFVRYLVIGLYVGCVTCAGFAWWFTWAPVSHSNPPGSCNTITSREKPRCTVATGALCRFTYALFVASETLGCAGICIACGLQHPCHFGRDGWLKKLSWGCGIKLLQDVGAWLILALCQEGCWSLAYPSALQRCLKDLFHAQTGLRLK